LQEETPKYAEKEYKYADDEDQDSYLPYFNEDQGSDSYPYGPE
jgi:hypothetical protein